MKKISVALLLLLTFAFGVSTASAAYFLRYLTVGSSGSDVGDLQIFLASRDFLPATTNPTGYFGESTKAALKKFQQSVGIEATGYLGYDTITYIENILGTSQLHTESTSSSTITIDYVVPLNAPSLPNGKLVSKGSARIYGAYANNLKDIKAVFKSGTKEVKVSASLDFANAVQFVVPELYAGSYYLYVESGVKKSNMLEVIVFDKNTANIPAPSITITSPKGGQSYKSKEKLNVNWSAKNLNQKTHDLIVYLYSPIDGDVAQRVISKAVVKGSGSGKVSIDLPSIEKTTEYRINICDEETPNPAAPGKPFCIHTDIFTVTPKSVSTPNPTSTAFYVKVQSPNGDEKFKEDEIVPIKFTGNLKDKDMSGFTIQLYKGVLGTATYEVVKTIATDWIGGSPYNWKVPKLKEGEYSINIFANGLKVPGKDVGDSSDRTFTIKAASIPATPTSTVNYVPKIDMVRGVAAENFQVYSGEKTAIEGKNLIYSGKDTEVFVGGKKGSVTQYNDSVVYFTAPELSSGRHDLYLRTTYGKSEIVKVNVVGKTSTTIPPTPVTPVTSYSASVTSPAANATIKAGSKFVVRGTVKSLPDNAKVAVYLVGSNGAETKIRDGAVYACTTQHVCTGFKASPLGMNTVMPADTATGSYRIKVVFSVGGKEVLTEESGEFIVASAEISKGLSGSQLANLVEALTAILNR